MPYTVGYEDEELVRLNETTDEIFDFLLPKIIKQEWDIVAQLAFQIKNKNTESAGDCLLNKLIEEANKSKDEKSWNLLSFTSRCLDSG